MKFDQLNVKVFMSLLEQRRSKLELSRLRRTFEHNRQKTFYTSKIASPRTIKANVKEHFTAKEVSN